MPGENYESEIENGTNKRTIQCKYCPSVILSPASASFTAFKYKLPLVRQTKGEQSAPETEDVTSFWAVKDIYTFTNVGFSNTVGDTKYLTCADCEAGPIGYHDTSDKMSYVALNRVIHK